MNEMTRQEQAVLTRVLRQIGRRGGYASAAAMTPRQRRARAIKAAKASAAVRTARKEAANA